MSRGKKKDNLGLSSLPEQKESFDLDTVLLMASVVYVISEAIEEKTLELATSKKCVPKEYAEAAIKQLGLGEWLGR